MDRFKVAEAIAKQLQNAILFYDCSGIDISLDCGTDHYSYLSFESYGEENTMVFDSEGTFLFHHESEEAFQAWSDRINKEK